MLRLAVSNLIQNKTRLLVSVGGVGLALTLVLFFGAVFTGAQGRMTVYIDNAGADVWVSQAGVRTMHMSESTLPATITAEVAAVPGVDGVVSILYTEGMLQAGGREYIIYVFGVPDDAPFGGPWRVVNGAPKPGPGEIIIDHAIAAQAGLELGDEVTVLGQRLSVAGLMSGTSSVASSVSFISHDDFARVRGGGDVVSYVLVSIVPEETAAAVADRVAQQVDGVTVQTRQQFAAQERALVKDMMADIINIMNTAGYLTGLAVVALTVYIATMARRREYGVLKAMGVRNGKLYQVVVWQALICVALGLALGLAITLVLSAVIPRFNELLVLSVSPASVFRVALVSVLLAGLAALLPARQLAGLEPVAITRRG